MTLFSTGILGFGIQAILGLIAIPLGLWLTNGESWGIYLAYGISIVISLAFIFATGSQCLMVG